MNRTAFRFVIFVIAVGIAIVIIHSQRVMDEPNAKKPEPAVSHGGEKLDGQKAQPDVAGANIIPGRAGQR